MTVVERAEDMRMITTFFGATRLPFAASICFAFAPVTERRYVFVARS